MFLGGGMKAENPDETHMENMRFSTQTVTWAQVGTRDSGVWGRNGTQCTTVLPAQLQYYINILSSIRTAKALVFIRKWWRTDAKMSDLPTGLWLACLKQVRIAYRLILVKTILLVCTMFESSISCFCVHHQSDRKGNAKPIMSKSEYLVDFHSWANNSQNKKVPYRLNSIVLQKRCIWLYNIQKLINSSLCSVLESSIRLKKPQRGRNAENILHTVPFHLPNKLLYLWIYYKERCERSLWE